MPDSKPESNKREYLIDELRIASDLLRHYMTLQLAQLSVFMALMSGLFLIIWKIKDGPRELYLICVIFGAISSGCLWIMWETHAYLVGKLLKRFAFLEKQLCFNLLSKLPGMPELRWRPSCWGQRLFYFIFFLLWSVVSIGLIKRMFFS